MTYLISAIVFVIMLSVLVLIHEVGHFFVARWCGVKVEEFGFGFPPRATAWIRGETTYSLNWLPLGGYVRMLGQDDFSPQRHSNDARSYERATPFKRILIALAGVTMNLLLAISLLWFGYTVGMHPMLRPIESAPVVRGLIAGEPATHAGILEGDELLEVNGVRTVGVKDFSSALRASPNREVTILYRRGGEEHTVIVTPNADGRIGVSIEGQQSDALVRLGAFDALREALSDTWLGIKLTTVGVWDLLTSIFTKLEMTEEVGGPVRIAQVTHIAVQVGWDVVLQLAALLSLSLAVLNVLPFPALDGGHVLFVLLEILRGKPLQKQLMERIQMTGMALLLLLIAATMYHDVVQLIN